MADYPYLSDIPESDNIRVLPIVHIDKWAVWRHSNNMGYVHLCFAILMQAINDFFYGDPQDVLDSAFFFEVYDTEDFNIWQGSRYPLIQQVLDISGLPVLIERYYECGAIPTREELELLERHFKTMTIDTLKLIDKL